MVFNVGGTFFYFNVILNLKMRNELILNWKVLNNLKQLNLLGALQQVNITGLDFKVVLIFAVVDIYLYASNYFKYYFKIPQK